MKNLLILFVLISSSFVFGQSKKTINKELKLQLEAVKKLNDSINAAVSDQLKFQFSLQESIAYFEELSDRKLTEIDGLDKKIDVIRADLTHSGYDPEQLVKEKDLLAIHSLMNETYVIEGVVNPSSLVKVEGLNDISTEKIKAQNQLLSSKINEYKLASENNATVLQQQKDVSKALKQQKEMVNEEFERFVRVNLMLESRYLKLQKTQLELEKKQEEDPSKAPEESTKKSATKPNFDPPVILRLADDSGWPQESNDAVPPPISEIDYPKAPEIYEVVEEPAEFPGGFSALKIYLQNNLKYPKNAIELDLQGKVFVKFIVSATGELSDIQVKRGIADCQECSEEAIRLVSNMPKWIPAKNRGVVVKSYFNLPIVFKLEQ